ncbi:hypothetical protein U8D42_12770 [Mycobacterium europaeum]|uniref:hypothetical protein n=1 Tax=Mycobacterium europaeum TaxID=761804 RepID=UPI002AE00F38|nr:hypothetical protein [Mycobacterium europaeum]MEA1160661.1 hypothetical protein [Mycobacterium europaeum]
MRSGQRWVADAFLAAVGEIKLNEPTGLPLYKIDELLRLARMLAVELIDETDAESLALLELTDVVDQWCWDSTNPLLILRFLAARRAHCDTLAAEFNADQ